MSSLFVGQEEPAKRACDADGDVYGTACFQGPFADRPHFHLLECGHTIKTAEIQRCGVNCKLLDAPKCFERPFLCPHVDCAKERKKRQAKDIVFIKPRNRRSAPVQPRGCRLGHVYGQDDQADRNRRHQKENAVLGSLDDLDMGESTAHYRTRHQKALLRDRSRSPVRGRVLRQEDTVSDRELIHTLSTEDDAFDKAMDMPDASARQILDTRLKSLKQFEDEVESPQVAKALYSLQLSTTPDLKQQIREVRRRELALDAKPKKKVKRSKAVASVQKDGQLSTIMTLCDQCERDLIGEYFSCSTCVHDCISFDLCKKCFKKHRNTHPLDHHFENQLYMGDESSNSRPLGPENQPTAIDEEDENQIEQADANVKRYCKCNTISTQYLIPCLRCKKYMHPSCNGTGELTDESSLEDADRDSSQRHDFDQWITNDRFFLCEECKGTFDAIVEANKTQVPHMRAKKRDEDRERRQKQKQANDYYKPTQTVQMRVEKEKARTPAQKRAFEAKWQEILAQQAQESENAGDQGDGLVESEEQLNADIADASQEKLEEDPKEAPAEEAKEANEDGMDADDDSEGGQEYGMEGFEGEEMAVQAEDDDDVFGALGFRFNLPVRLKQ